MSSFVRAPASWRRLILSFVIWTTVTLLLGMGLDRMARSRTESTEPAGFALGLAHGALMPMALPALVMGRDVAIYARSNSGRPYHFGYVLGVNVCGAIFFGWSFWWYGQALRKAHQPRAAAQS